MPRLILLFCLVFIDKLCFAYCPLLIDEQKLHDQGWHFSPTATRAYSYDKAWRSEALEVLYLDDRGLPMSNADALLYGDSPIFRFMLRDTAGGARAPMTIKPPCLHRKQLEVASRLGERDAYIYLFWCRGGEQQEEPSAFIHKKDSETLEGKYFSYRYRKTNHMLFDNIWMHVNEGRRDVARRATLQIRADIKNFFTLNFSTDDIESKIFETSSGPVSFATHMMFYLRVLFFKIELALKTSLLLFDHNVQIPMVLHMPVDAHRWVRPGSGLFYTWESRRDDVRYDLAQSSIPIFDKERIKVGHKMLGEAGLKNCGDAPKCFFKLVLSAHDKPVTMTFGIPRDLVGRGFYPQFVTDLSAAQKQLGYPEAKAAEAGWDRVGVYFENSGTEKGEHLWDFWLGIDDKERDHSCLEPVLTFVRR